MLLGVGVVVLALFARHELRSPAPLIEFGLLRDRMLATSLVTLFGIQFAVFAETVLLALYLQHGLGLSALAAGAVIAVAGVGSPLLSVAVGRATDRRGPRSLALPGLVLATTGLLALGLAAPLGGVAVLVPGLLLFSLARPFVFTPASAGPFLALGPERRAFAASLATESRQLGAVFGVALTSATLAAVPVNAAGVGDSSLVDGFRVAVLIAAAACGVAMLVVWQRMPARPR